MEELFITTTDYDLETYLSELYTPPPVTESKSEASMKSEARIKFRENDLIFRDENGRRVRSPSPSPERRVFLKR